MIKWALRKDSNQSSMVENKFKIIKSDRFNENDCVYFESTCEVSIFAHLQM